MRDYLNGCTVLKYTMFVLLILIIDLGQTAQASPKSFNLDSIGGDIRLFYSALGPLRFEPPTPETLTADSDLNQSTTSGMLTARYKLKGKLHGFTWSVHPLFSSRPASTSSGIALNANPSQFAQAIPLSLNLIDSTSHLAQLRADRLWIAREWSDFKLTIGRQAITLGQGRAFTPLDRLAPFSPTSIDQLYKPGLDAARLDYWWGVAGQLSFITAYRQDWSREGMAYVLTAQDHFGGWDLGIVLGEFQRDQVLGFSMAGSLATVSVYGDLSWTRSSPELILLDGEKTFGRASLGMTWSWAQGGGGHISSELYWQEDGAADTDFYLNESQDPRFLRGERWFLGRYYGMFSVQQAITALIQTSASLLMNFEDDSGLIGSLLTWSISQDVDLMIGGYGGYGLGLRISSMPAMNTVPIMPQSEFGTLQWMGFAMMASYF